ncbi:MAG: hypothetical protein K6E59_01700 [Bacilli bacterium]|nr:hypothetical protein [Bacilli bacterium]
MDDIATLLKNGKTDEAIALPEDSLHDEELFLRVSALLEKGKGNEAIQTLVSHREELFSLNPLLTLKANFETRFALGQFDEAEEDLAQFVLLPYASQRVEEALAALPSTIQAMRLSSKQSATPDLEKALESLASPSSDLEILSALNALKKVGELEDYEGLVAELLTGPWHNDVKTYALMLLSAKGCQKKVTLVKNGERFTLVPAKIGSPYGLPEYKRLRDQIMALNDSSLSQTAGELLDLYALSWYPRRFLLPDEEKNFLPALLGVAKGYLGQTGGELTPKQQALKEKIATQIEANPPLLG